MATTRAIQDAIRKGDTETLKKMAFDKGPASVKNARDLYANTALHTACFKGIKSLFDYALELGVPVDAVNAAGDTALILAAKRGDVAQMMQLIEATADVNKANDHGNTALHYAAFWRHHEAVEYLSKLAVINVLNNFRKTPAQKSGDLSRERGEKPVQAQVRSRDNATKEAKELFQSNVPPDWETQATSIQILDTISQSRTAILYRGSWKGKPVAVKVPVLVNDLSEDDIALISKEITAIRKLSHPILAPIVAACVVPPDLCCLFDFTEHGNLSMFLHNPTIDMTPTHALKIAFDTVKGLVYLHEYKTPMVHGNLKSSNILLMGDGTIRLTDYGFKDSMLNARKLYPNYLFNTEWLAPEVLAGDDISTHEQAKAVDMYAFGILLFEIVTRQYPYEQRNAMAVGLQVLVEERRPVVPDYVPQSLSQIMETCWQTDPSIRPASKSVLNLLMAVRL
ncbi:kinase-like domain-containing protein [Entophlyctis helioformis]|nr:kinase-like domain-containing protein [Entophlyctis helioformis]